MLRRKKDKARKEDWVLVVGDVGTSLNRSLWVLMCQVNRACTSETLVLRPEQLPHLDHSTNLKESRLIIENATRCSMS